MEVRFRRSTVPFRTADAAAAGGDTVTGNTGGAADMSRRGSVVPDDRAAEQMRAQGRGDPRERERGREDQRGGRGEEEEDVMTLIMSGPYAEV